MRLSDDIKSASYMKNNTNKVLEQVNISGPMVITQNGEASAVLMGVKDYDQLQESLALLKVFAIGKNSIEAGHAAPADEVFARLRERRKGPGHGKI